MVDFTVSVPGLSDLVGRLGKDEPIAKAVLKEALHEGTLIFEGGVKSAIQEMEAMDTRTLFRSIVSEVEMTPYPRGRVGVLRGPATSYARVVHEGRRPGATPPPVAPIARWLKRKGRDPRLAYVVARSIGKRGVKGRPFLKQGFDQKRGAVERIFRDVPGRFARRLIGKG